MTGKFHLSWGEFVGFKHPNALRYEVALNLALGAKASIGDQMHPYGFLDPATYELIGAAYSESEKVEDYCYGGINPINEIAVLGVEAMTGNRWNLGEVGSSRILLEGKYLFTFIDKCVSLDGFKLLIIPEGINVADALLIEKIKAFVASGGKLLAVGSSGKSVTALFDLGCEWLGASESNPAYLAPAYNATGLSPTSYVFLKQMYKTRLTDENAKVLGYGKGTFFNRAPEHFCSHRHTPYTLEDGTPAIVIGKDGAYIVFDIFSEYADVGCYCAKEAVMKVIDALLGEEKTLTTNLPSCGVVTLNEQEKDSRLVLHALYASPIKRGADARALQVIEELLPIYDTEFAIKTERDIKSVVLVPQNEEISFEQKDGVLSFKLNRMVCHQIVVINY